MKICNDYSSLPILKNEHNKYGEDLPTYPNYNNIFRCFHYKDVVNTRVVILGQDPYHGEGQAIGLCFGVDKGISSPPSLKNILKELKNDGWDLMGDLTLECWARQGVLLLNSALTVRKKSPASHMSIWLPFTKYIIDHLNTSQKDIVFVAWGAFALGKLTHIDQTKHKLLISSHPSPLSARRKLGSAPAFIGSAPFSRINHYLTGTRPDPVTHQDKICWCPLGRHRK